LETRMFNSDEQYLSGICHSLLSKATPHILPLSGMCFRPRLSHPALSQRHRMVWS
jgi:hypothetical protein